MLKRYLNELSRKEGRSIDSLTYVFCTDDFLLNINQRYLQHDDYTDIITFDLAGAGQLSISGEVYISVDRVVENARILGVSFLTEVERVVFHGLLHLCGYTDKLPKQKQQMRAAEDRHLALFEQFVQAAHCST